MEKQKQYEFFSAKKFEEKINAAAQSVDRKPFLKLAFLTVAAACFIGGSFSYTNNLWHEHALNSAKAEKEQERITKLQQETNYKNSQLQAGLYYKKIKNISKEDMQSFLEYLRIHQELYDARVALLNKDVTGAANGYSDSISTDREGKMLVELLQEHRKYYSNAIAKSSMMYEEIQNDIKVRNFNDLKEMLYFYSTYQAGAILKNPNLEELISKCINMGNSDNIAYFNKNHTRDNLANLENKSVQEVKSIKKM